MQFSFDQLSKPLSKVTAELGYTKPTEIQELAIPLLLAEETDFVGQAQTGTGKTAAFCLPLIEKLDPNLKEAQALILAPTRELANQIHEEILKFIKYLNFHTAIVYGGVGYREQVEDLRTAQIVIATPGRAIDLLNRKKLLLKNTEYFIIDEADEMLKMGFIEDVELLMDKVSSKAKTWMFSATMPRPIVRLMQEKLNEPKVIQVQSQSLSSANVELSYCPINKKNFFTALKAILLTENDFYGIVFCETREETKNLNEKIAKMGKRVVALHGDLNQRQRDLAMESFKSRNADILVCTDVGARGLDVSHVTHVINMGLPHKTDSYIHRVGRTGRAGQTGKAISLVAPTETGTLRSIERLINKKIERYKLPTSGHSKQTIVASEIDKMTNLKRAISENGDDFKVDDCFEKFNEFFKDMNKEEIVKLMFTHRFNRELRQVDESLQNLTTSMNARPSRKPAFSKSRGRSSGGGKRNFRSKPPRRKFSRSNHASL